MIPEHLYERAAAAWDGIALPTDAIRVVVDAVKCRCTTGPLKGMEAQHGWITFDPCCPQHGVADD